jgi:hypothetical protein
MDFFAFSGSHYYLGVGGRVQIRHGCDWVKKTVPNGLFSRCEDRQGREFELRLNQR